MKTVGYILLITVSLFTFTPRSKVIEIPITKMHYSNIHNDSLQSTLDYKIDSLECMKEEIILLQKEIGIR